MTMPSSVTVTLPNDREIRVSREFDAPRSLVYEAHTQPDLVKKWLLGPPGWTMPVCNIDLRPGGSYLYTWRSDKDGNEFSIGGEYREVVPQERIVTLENFMGDTALCTLTFEERNGRTLLTQSMVFETTEKRDGALQTGMTDGMGQSYDRLEAVVLVGA